MRWTQQAHQTSAHVADGEAMWSWRLDAGVKSATMLYASRWWQWQKARSPGRAWN